MKNDPYTPKALHEANARLEERKKKIEQITQATNKPKRKGLLSRLFGWMK